MGRTFPMGVQPESATRNPTPEWDIVSQWALKRKAHPGIQLESGMRFPNSRPTGNRIPQFDLKMGHTFPTTPQRKVHPRIDAQSGMRFPNGYATGNCIPESGPKVGPAFRLSLDWETPSHSHQKTGGPNTVRAARSVRYVERLLARHVIPDDAVAVGENVVTARRHGRHTVNGVHPTARTAMLLLGQTANGGDIRAVR